MIAVTPLKNLPLMRLLDNHEVLGPLQKWRSQMKTTTLFKDCRNTRRTATLAHTLDLLRDEELHLFFAVGMAAWMQQEPMDVFDCRDNMAPEPVESTHQIQLTVVLHQL